MTHDDNAEYPGIREYLAAVTEEFDVTAARRAHLDHVRTKREARQRRKDRIETVVAIVGLASGLTCLGAMAYAVSALMEWLDLPHNVEVAFAIAGIAYLVYWVTKPRVTVEVDKD